MPFSVSYRLAPALLVLLGLLSSCAAYDRVFHPHRLGTPPMTASAKAKAKAAEKARHKGTTLAALSAEPAKNGDDAATGGDAPAPAAAPAADEAKSKPLTYNNLPDNIRNTYDKQGLLKKSMVQRFQQNSRKLHHYDTRPLTPNDASRDARHLRKHPKGSGKDRGGREPAPKEATEVTDPGFTPDPTQPAAPETAPKPAKAPAPRPAKAAPIKPKVKVDKAKEAELKQTKLKAGGEHVEKPAKPKKDKKAPKAPKPDPTQPLTGQD